MKRYSIQLSFLVFLFTYAFPGLPVVVQAQEIRAAQVEQSKELSFSNPHQRSLKLPFKSINNLIIIPLQINGSDTLHFILDTGINTSIICDLASGEKLDLKYSRQILLQGLGTGTPLEAIHAFGNEINISGIKGINQDFFVLLENIFKLSEKLGSQVDGILSYNVFSSFITKIDYEKEVITIYNPEYYRYKKHPGKAVSVPLIINNDKPFIYVWLQTPDGSLIPLKVMIDTGASSSFWLDANTIKDFQIPPTAKRTFLGSSLSGDVHGYLARFNKASIGNFDLNNVLVSFPDSIMIDQSSRIENRNGSMGSETMRRFSIIIDYPNEIITFIKNDNYKEPFSYNKCGIELICPYPGVNFYQISQVYVNSPAEKAGIHKNDFIHSINGTESDKLSLNDIYKLFQGRTGNKIRITVDRAGSRIKFSLKLKDYILSDH
jgi:PDZ domain/Aspartyl protease